MKILSVALLFLCNMAYGAVEGALEEGLVNPGYHEKPAWFKQSFLDLGEDLADARDNSKLLMLYFYQDGCPYCKKLLSDNFTRDDIVAKMQKDFDLIDLNMWGDRSVTTPDGRVLTEKDFAREQKVMFTPTIIVMQEDGSQLFRINGYYPPKKFLAALDYLTTDASTQQSFVEYYRSRQAAGQKPKLQTSAFIDRGNDLHALLKESDKPLLVLFEDVECQHCAELHGDVFRRLPIYQKLRQFNVAQINIDSEDNLTVPGGKTMSQSAYSRHLGIQYTPSLMFYTTASAASGEPVFRSEAYLKSFHIEALLDYILTESYLSEPEFQRFVQQRAETLREKGIDVDLWE